MPLRAVACNACAGDSGPERARAVRATGLRGVEWCPITSPRGANPPLPVGWRAWAATCGNSVRGIQRRCSGTAWALVERGRRGHAGRCSRAEPRRGVARPRAKPLPGDRMRGAPLPCALRCSKSCYGTSTKSLARARAAIRRRPRVHDGKLADGPTGGKAMHTGLRGLRGMADSAMLGEVLGRRATARARTRRPPTTWRRERWK